ncbi:MAG: exodeoxyribonuclease VII large subunit, partial [Nitrospinales bacterium]
MTLSFPEPLSSQTSARENQPKVYTVSEITQDIRAILESAFDTVWLEGEISNYRVA